MSLFNYVLFINGGALVAILLSSVLVHFFPYMPKITHVGLILVPYLLYCIVLTIFL